MSYSNPAVHVREACPADSAQIGEFNCALALETEGKRLDAAVVEAGVARALQEPMRCRYFVAESEGRIVGQLMITDEWSDWRAGVFWWIQSVYVRPELRRRGIMRTMYEHVARAARREPAVCGLRLYVDQDNAGAMATYQRLGLNPSGHVVYETDWSDLAERGDGSDRTRCEDGTR